MSSNLTLSANEFQCGYEEENEFQLEENVMRNSSETVEVVVMVGYYASELGVEITKKDGSKIPSLYGDGHHVWWGSQNYPGRIPTGLWTAYRTQAAQIIWACCDSYLSDGMCEAEYMQKYAIDRFDILQTDFPRLFDSAGWFRSKNDFESWIRDISVFDKKSSTTRTVMEEVIKIINEKFGDRTINIHFVTSANHASRVLRDAAAAFYEGVILNKDGTSRNVAERLRGSAMVNVVVAKTSYGEGNPIRTVVYDNGTESYRSWV
ncbi:MAG: hypothetical protein WAV46_03145 [Candidatus Moraniibacteriota bacterium]